MDSKEFRTTIAPDNYYLQCPAIMNESRQFTDFRTATVREQFNRHVNGFSRDDEMRNFYITNARTIMDATRKHIKNTSQCSEYKCLHENPTLSSNELDFQEFRNYNLVATGRAKKNDGECAKPKDYWMTY